MRKLIETAKKIDSPKTRLIAGGSVALVAAGAYGISRLIRRKKVAS